ncbi:hypothetical protein B0T26DRAFT_427674 [Lasiosphaeria miniovina]|uniref:Uncharacterized protein n=1 Tax=Lasiosphaeria miniovina TaxID=1954250 RepID=A0AA40A657_9PEZI|nr:uncharacterized protein B0T26DRAFT_427674 [Lasiosphaeria miniovina]KAK0709873.1 hypothetical protein B0T26DRAFT_427674 [Lasiosphaeria miniovina]
MTKTCVGDVVFVGCPSCPSSLCCMGVDRKELAGGKQRESWAKEELVMPDFGSKSEEDAGPCVKVPDSAQLDWLLGPATKVKREIPGTTSENPTGSFFLGVAVPASPEGSPPCFPPLTTPPCGLVTQTLGSSPSPNPSRNLRCEAPTRRQAPWDRCFSVLASSANGPLAADASTSTHHAPTAVATAAAAAAAATQRVCCYCVHWAHLPVFLHTDTCLLLLACCCRCHCRCSDNNANVSTDTTGIASGMHACACLGASREGKAWPKPESVVGHEEKKIDD